MEQSKDGGWHGNLLLGMIVFVTAIVVMCTGVFLTLSGQGGLLYGAFVIFGGSVALLSSVAKIAETVVARVSKKPSMENGGNEKEITDEGIRYLDQLSRDCKRVESEKQISTTK